MLEDTPFTSASALARAIRHREISPVEVVEMYLERIDQRNDYTNAYATVISKEARDRAHEAEETLASGGPIGALHGVPIAIKDLFAYKEGVRHTFGSVPFADHVPEEDAILVKRLESAGAIVLGKTNTPEFGWGDGKTDNELFGPTVNPFNTDRTAGGSSGGSAAAVADGLAALAQGSDAGGSVRIPASACGVVGVFPSFDRTPIANRPDGLGHHSPFTQFGPLTRSVEDAALFLEVISGPHDRDPLSHDANENLVSAVRRSVSNLDVAFSPTLGVFPVSESVRRIVADAVADLNGAGTTVERTDPEFDHDYAVMRDAFEIQIAVTYAELAANLQDNAGVDLDDEHADEVSDRLLEFIDAGKEVDAVEFKKTDVVRTAMYDAITALFKNYDLIVTPTLAVPPFQADEDPPSSVAGKSIDPRFDWFLTWPFNMTGHPAITVPAGTTEDGLPVGLQVVAPRHDDAQMFAAAGTIERVRPWHGMYGDDTDA